MDEPTDVADLQAHLVVELARERQGKRVHVVGPEVRIERRARTRGDAVHAGIQRLRQRLARRRYTAQPDRPCQRGTRWSDWRRSAAGTVGHRIEALHRLDQAGSQQRNQHQIHAVQPSIGAAVSASNHRRAVAEHIPGCG